MRPTLHRLLYKLWYVSAVIVILAALLVSTMTLLTPVLNKHRAEFEKMASDLTGRPILIKQVSLHWHGYSPEFDLDGVTALEPQTQVPQIEVERLRLDFSIFRTLLERKVFVNNITIIGATLTVNQTSGQIQFGNLPSINIHDSLTGQSVDPAAAGAWLFTQPRVALQNIDIHYIAPGQAERYLTIKYLSLRNDFPHHVLDARVILAQDLPTKIKLQFAWDGDIQKFELAKGNLFLEVEGLSLVQWFSKREWKNLQVKQGLANVKLWAMWSRDHWDTIQANVQAHDLEVYSSLQKKAQSFNNVSANIGWKQDGGVQTIAGDQIQIDFPDHSWPEMNFAVKVSADAAGNLTVNKVNFNYLNLHDVSQMLLATTIPSDDIRQQLVALDPKGEFENVEATLPSNGFDIHQLKVSGQFTDLSVNVWNKFPGVNNFSGSIDWHGSSGKLKLDSSKAMVTVNQIFEHPMSFDKIIGDATLQTDAEGNWSLQSNNISIANPDCAASGKFGIISPVNDTPSMNVDMSFSVLNATKIGSYLPEKAFDPDLVKWLNQAFKNGHADSGRAIIQGRLADFPFDKNNGKFYISAHVIDVDLHYAPDWPAINHIDGMLTFAGRSINIDVNSGEIYNIPLKNVHAVIPYIGDDQPQILTVEAPPISADMSEGLRIILESPLKQTIGRNLAKLNMSGPMQLKLGLSVPLRDTDHTKVTGTVTMTDSRLDLSQWHLSLDKLKGSFQFTEDGLEAQNLQGELFNSPVTLNITTLTSANQSRQIRVDLSGNITVPTIEDWLKISISKVAQGNAAYQAQLFLSSKPVNSVSAGSDQLVLKTDLMGVSINAPTSFGKTATEAKAFQLMINLQDNPMLKMKMDYANTLSAALSLNTKGKTLELFGGEIHLGGGDATWQNAPGILLTGHMKEIDWTLWQHYFTSLRSGNGKVNPAKDLAMLRGINMSADVVNLGGQQLKNAKFDITNNRDSWLIRLESQEIGGEMTLPYNFAGQTIQAHFSYINLGAQNNGNSNQLSLQARDLPALSIICDQVNFNDIHIGHVALDTVPSNGGMVIKQLQIDEPALRFTATGNWAGNRTHLQGEANSPRIGDALSGWGVNSKNLIGSSGKITFDVSWSNAPYRPTLNGLEGKVFIKLGEGRIVELSESSDAKLGLGRMLNLFSLSSIPRRLSLNFSDLFQKGYAFDDMTGDFQLRSGSVFTTNMHFNGPVAGVDINGRVGFAAKDFDLKIGVTPYVTGSLPLVATLAGGPIAGVATFVVDKVISSQVSRATTYQYTVTGPWSNPAWNSASGSMPHSN